MKSVFFGLFLLAVLAFMPATALAAGVPSFDANAHCKEVPDFSGGNYVTEKGCRDMEAKAKTAVERMDVPAKIMNHCTEVARISGGSYSVLRSCIQMEINAKQSLEN